MAEPRGSRGNGRTVWRVADVLHEVLAGYGLNRRRGQLELERVWAKVAGAELGARTRVGRKCRDQLEILVDDAVLLHELVGFRLEELQQKMQAATGGRIRSLRFRLA